MIGERRITGRTVLFGMLAFFGTVIGVNLAFVYFALDSWPGLAVEKAYEKGLAYNQTLDAAERQARLGWKSDVAVDAGHVTVRLTGSDDAPIGGLAVEVEFRRPVSEGSDVTVRLEEAAPGVYSAALDLPLPGRWNANLRAREADETEPRYRMVHELVVER